jgi:hypothetical protein
MMKHDSLHDSSGVQALGAASELSSQLVLAWELDLSWETMKGGRLEWEEGAGARSPSLLADAGGNRAHIDATHEPGWALYRWQPPVERQSSPPRGAGVATSARRLMALERCRMRRRTGGERLDRRGRKTPRRS